MKKSLIWIAALSATVAFPTAASACDLHGTGVFGGMHRFNPFAKAMPLDRAPAAPVRSTSSSDDEKSESAREAERTRELRERDRDSQRQQERRPREWEGEFGNGPMTTRS